MTPKRRTRAAKAKERQADSVESVQESTASEVDPWGDAALDQDVVQGSARARAHVKPQRIQRVEADGATRLQESIQSGISRCKDKYPPRTREDFLALLPKATTDDEWTEEDEKQMKSALKATARWKDLSGVRDATVGVWKLFFRFTGRLVTDVLGLSTGLVYKGQKKWPDSFCQPLHTYLCLPFMRGNVMRLRLALQWAVICRTNDRRRHYLNGCEQDVFLRMLAEVMHHQDGTVGPATLRRIALRLYMDKFGQHGDEEPEWSALMANIEARRCPPDKKRRGADKGKGPAPDLSAPDAYEITTSDLNAVIQAADDMAIFFFKSHHHSQTAKEVIGLARAVKDAPFKEDVVKATKAVLLAEQRQKQQQSRAAQGSPRAPT